MLLLHQQKDCKFSLKTSLEFFAEKLETRKLFESNFSLCTPWNL